MGGRAAARKLPPRQPHKQHQTPQQALNWTAHGVQCKVVVGLQCALILMCLQTCMQLQPMIASKGLCVQSGTGKVRAVKGGYEGQIRYAGEGRRSEGGSQE